MWPRWGKSPSRSNSSNFSHSTFKDIQSLCTDENENNYKSQQDNNSNSNNNTTKKPSLFHRVRLSTSVLRHWATIATPSSTNSNQSESKLSPKPITTTVPEHISAPQPEYVSSGIFQEPKPITTTVPELVPVPEPEPEYVSTPTSAISLEGTETRIVVYLTSLRAVRKTFEDCRAVQSILRGFRVRVDERDLLMDAGFLEEIQGILGQKETLSLPRVFIGGRYIGGAEEVRQLHETGELKKFVQGLPQVEPGACEGCGGYRFLLCDQCDGSHKCHNEKGGFFSCTNCNENGLIRCPACTYVPP